MRKNEDGNVTLTKREFSELNKAYQKLYDIIGCMPTFLGDYCKNGNEYMRILKWHCQLNGKEFHRQDWE